MKVCSTTVAPLTLPACASQLRKFIIDNILKPYSTGVLEKDDINAR